MSGSLSDAWRLLVRILGGSRSNAVRFAAAACVDRALLAVRERRGGFRRRLSRIQSGFRQLGFEPDLFRTIEYSYALEAMHEANCETWLDLGCGDTPFGPLALADGAARSVILVDSDAEALAVQQTNLRTFGLEGGRFHILEADLVADSILPDLPVEPAGALLVSTIEHLPGDGDIRLMNRLWEILPTGAPVVVTVPALHAYEENVTGHYHGLFERRYDLRAFLSRLQVNGFEVEDLRFIAHREGFAARVVNGILPSLNRFFAEWYRLKNEHPSASRMAPALGRVLLDVTPLPKRSMIGILATLRRGERHVLDPVADFSSGPRVLSLPDPAERAQGVQVLCPMPHLVMDWADRIAIPLALINLWEHDVPAGPIRAGELHVGAHMKSMEDDQQAWDYAHLPLPCDLPARSMILTSVTLDAPQGLCDFEFTIDLCREGEYWQGDVALEPACVRVTLRDRKDPQQD